MGKVERTGARLFKGAIGTWVALVVLYQILSFARRHGGPTVGPFATRAADLSGLDASFRPGQ